METLTITEAKNRFTERADRAAAEHDHFTTEGERQAILDAQGGCRSMGTDQWRVGGSPWQVGKPLPEPYEGLHSARRGTHRILHKIDEGKHAIESRSIRHRADAYRT